MINAQVGDVLYYQPTMEKGVVIYAEDGEYYVAWESGGSTIESNSSDFLWSVSNNPKTLGEYIDSINIKYSKEPKRKYSTGGDVTKCSIPPMSNLGEFAESFENHSANAENTKKIKSGLTEEDITNYYKGLNKRYPSKEDMFENLPKHMHYFKDVSNLDVIDVYRVLNLFGVTNPCLQHAIKKLLVAGGRGYKDISKDVQEAIDTLERWKDMKEENNA